MMNYEKMLFFPKTEMSQINSILPPPPPSHNRTHQQHFQQEQQTQNTTQFVTPTDAYSAYADTFDLSLLPDECDLPLSPACSAYSNSSQSQTLDYIPTTVYQHTTINNSNNSPQIKIERNWSDLTETIKNEPIYLDDQFQQLQQQQQQQQSQQLQQQQQEEQQNQHKPLQRKRSDPISIPQPPPAHPQIYPSPQSSPEQSEYSFHARFGSNYSSLSSSRTSLYPPSPSFSSPSFLSPSSASPSFLSPSSSSSYSSSGYSSSRFSSSPYSSSPYSSSNCSTTSFSSSTPCTTATCSTVDISRVKQEFHTLPPSPPESSCEAPSPHSFADIKSEPLDADVETLIDINSLLSKSLENLNYSGGCETETVPDCCQQLETLDEVKKEISNTTTCSQDHQLLREYLEDTTFQKKHNLKPLALESLIGGLGVRGDIEPVISLALEDAKREAEATCAKLQILPDPKTWTTTQVHAWLQSTIEQFRLPQINDIETKFPENGTTLALLSEEEFTRRAPESGSTIHAQLEIWKLAYSNGFQDYNPATALAVQQHSQQLNGNDGSAVAGNLWHITECGLKTEMDMDEGSDIEDDDALPPTSILTVTSTTISSGTSDTGTSATTTNTTAAITKPIGSTPARNGGSHIHLWQFLKELLAAPHINGTAIRWIDRTKGVFKIEDSVRVAKLWGRRKNRPAMNYDKLSRSIRQYYKKGIMKKTERSQRLVYQFCQPYNL